jgi:heme-degrading monooxygenase HmoA
MFARVITTQVAAGQLDSTVALGREELPAAARQPGFRGFYLLTDAETGKAMTISLWETRENLEAVEAQAASIRSRAEPAVESLPLLVEIYEVTLTG